jgi:hypothetical protein
VSPGDTKVAAFGFRRAVAGPGKVKTIAEGVAKTASENPDLYRQYREATDTEMAAQPAT